MYSEEPMANLTTAAKVKADMRIVDSGINANIDGKIAAASREIEAFCRQPIVATAVTLNWSGRDLAMRRPITYFPFVIASITGRTADFGSALATVAAETYELRYDEYGRQFIHSSAGFASGSTYAITLTVGYETVPADVEQVCIELVIDMLHKTNIENVGWNSLGKRSVGESSPEMGSRTTSYLDIRPDLQARLASYRVAML